MRVRVKVFELPPRGEVFVVKLSSEGEGGGSGALFVDEVYFGPFRVRPAAASPVDLEAEVIEVVDDDGRLCCYVWPPAEAEEA